MTLTENDRQRYDRQIRLPSFGVAGQERLKASRVLLIGAGGLGSPSSLYLAAAGVGHLTLVDDDRVSISNLQRQILFATQDAELGKADVATAKLRLLNPSIEILSHRERLTAARAEILFADQDVIVDGSDNFATRSFTSEVCRRLGKIHAYAGIAGFEGQMALFDPASGPCYRCLFPTLPRAGEVPNCDESGVIGALAGVLGSLQALAVIQHLAQVPARTPLGSLTVFDGLAMTSRTWLVPKRRDCPQCAGRVTAELDHEPLELRRDDPLPTAAVWIDVRTDDEVRERPFVGARHMPIGELAQRAKTLCPQTNYVVVCASGQRGRRAQELLRDRGLNWVWNLRGGLNETNLSAVPRDPRVDEAGAR